MKSLSTGDFVGGKNGENSKTIVVSRKIDNWERWIDRLNFQFGS